MTIRGGGERRSSTLLFVSVVLVACMISAVAYVFFVSSEKAKTEKLRTQAAAIQAEIDRANDYLRRHFQSLARTSSSVNEAAHELSRRVPHGPEDMDVGKFIDDAAHAANILDERWSPEGGLKMPLPADKDRVLARRLALNPLAMKTTVIDVEFHSRYKEFLALLKSLADAPRMIDVTNISLKCESGPLLAVKMEMRYRYE